LVAVEINGEAWVETQIQFPTNLAKEYVMDIKQYMIDVNRDIK